MEDQTLGQWLEERCQSEHLSLRQVAVKAGLSHQTIVNLLNSKKPFPQTLKKLAAALGGDHNQRIALEDKLLTLAGYRTPRPEEKLSEPLAQLIDRVRKFDEPRLGMMINFADFLVKIGEG